jgi:nucleoid DNA-binding protein/nucleoid-associated protein YgaU
MNKDKISVQDVIDSLAAKTDITKVQADDFFKTLISTIEETLLANDFVKIKNFGTFKLNWVAPRRSVNVQTGEDIDIDGFYKVVFTPEKNLKELVNKPFEHLESVALDGEKPQEEPNPMASLTAQAGTIKTLLTEIQSMSNAETAETAEIPEEKQPETITAKIEEEPKQVERPNYHEYESEREKKKRTGCWWFLLGVLLVLGVLIALYFIPPQNNAFQDWVNKNIFGRDTAAYDAERERERARMEAERMADYERERALQEEVVPDDFSRAFDDRLNNIEILTTVRMNNGSRLAHLAQRHFGSPHFWVYIYEANRDIITHPNRILIGTMIRIPRMNPLLVDANNPRAIEQALLLHEKYLNQR